MAGQRKPNSAKSTKDRKVRTRRKLDKIDPEALAAQQRVRPIDNPQELFADFWPEDETADQFNQAVRQWRREGKKDHV